MPSKVPRCGESEGVCHPPLTSSELRLTVRDRSLPIVATAATAAFMARLDAYVVNISLPAISQYFGVTMSQVSWIVLIFLLVLTSSLLIMGRIVDRMGGRRALQVGYLLFAVSSLLCGLAGSLPALIAARAVQALGAAMLQVATYSVVSLYLEPEKRGQALGVVTSSAALGIAVGSPLGGLITATYSWPWVFWINLPIGIVAAISATRVLPAPPAGRQAQPFDVVGSLLSFPAVLALVYALDTGGARGWSSPAIVACLALSGLFTLAFLLWERRCAAALVDLSLFRNVAFNQSLLACVLGFAALCGNQVLMPFYLQAYKGLDPRQAGLVFLAYSLVYLVLAPLAGRLSDRVSPVVLSAGGMLGATLAMAGFAAGLTHPGLVVPIVFLMGFGVAYSLFVSPNVNLIMAQAVGRERGAISALLNAVANFGSVIGAAVFETILSRALPGDHTPHEHAVSAAPAMAAGFAQAYMVGAAACALAFILSVMASRARR